MSIHSRQDTTHAHIFKPRGNSKSTKNNSTLFATPENPEENVAELLFFWKCIIFDHACWKSGYTALYNAIFLKISPVKLWRIIKPNNKHTKNPECRSVRMSHWETPNYWLMAIDFCEDQTKNIEVPINHLVINAVSTISVFCMQISVTTDECVINLVLTHCWNKWATNQHTLLFCFCTFDLLNKNGLTAACVCPLQVFDSGEISLCH